MSENQDVVAQAGTVSSEQSTKKAPTAGKKIQAEAAKKTAAEAPEYPKTITLVNNTYTNVAYPELGNVMLRGGETKVVEVKSLQIMATLQRNVDSFNTIGKWIAPLGVSIAPNALIETE